MGLFLESAKNEQLYLREHGRPGDNGRSAYEIWLEQGNEGTEEDFLESLKGDDYVLTEADKEDIAEMAAEKVQKPDIPQGMASEEWVNANFQPKGEYVTDEELEEKLKDVSPEGYATEEWTNENFQPKGNYLEEVPDEYITKTELEAKGYQTKTEAVNAYQPKGSYATTEQLAQTEAKIPTKVSQLGNDKNYLEAETDPTVPSWAKVASKPTYTKSEVGLGNVANERQYSANNPPPYPVTSVNGRTGDVEVEEKGTAAAKVTNHNADDEAHNDIRLLISALTKKVNDLLDSDDTTLDQMSEVVAYIKANRELLESYTTEKVNVADIIDNLTTSVSNKPLSAKQGVQLKALIDAIKVPTALSQLTGDSTHRTVTDSEKAAWNAKSDFSGEYADLKNKPTNVTDFTNDAGYQTAEQVQNYAQPKGNYATTSDVNNLQEQIYNTLDDDDISVEETETGSVVTIGSKTVNIENGKDGTIQIEPLFAESVEWLEENGDTSKVYILPNNLIFAYMYTEGEAASYTNWLPIADTTTKMASDEPATVMTGYFSGNRLNSSGLLKKATGYSATGFIPYTYKGTSDFICIQGSTCTPNKTYQQELCLYDSNHTFLGYGGFACATYDEFINGDNGIAGIYIEEAETGVYLITWKLAEMTNVKNGNIDTSKIAYFRFCTGDFANAIITVNEEISGGSGTEAGYKWASTGHSFIPTDYEDRIIELEKKASGASSVQSYIAKRNTYIAPVPSGYCESKMTFTDFSTKVTDTIKGETDLLAMVQRFRDLATANQGYITETLLGKDASNTYDIYKYELELSPAVRNTTSKMKKDKPVFIITAGLHGVEPDAVWEVYHFMQDICNNYIESEHLDYLRNNVKFVIVPISNPWGFVNSTYNNSNDVNLNKNFEHGFSYVANTAGSQLNTGANAYSEAEAVLLKEVFDEYSNAVFHLECHGKAGVDANCSDTIWFSLMQSLASELIEISANTVVHQIGCKLYELGYNADKTEGGYLTYYPLGGRPKDYTGTEYGMLSCTMEGSGRMGFASHTTFTKDEQRVNCEALENFILRVLDALNSRVEI